MSSVSRSAKSRRWPWIVAPLVVLALGAAAGLFYLQALGLRPGSQLRGMFSPPFRGMKQFTVLVLGVDADRYARRSDTIMLARLDLTRRRVGIISVPRDLRAAVPGHGEQKINGAYSLGGVDLTRQALQGLTGVPSDYYVTINSEGLARLVDALGGVEVDVDKRMYYRDRAQKLLIDLQPGVQRLNGQQAVGYVRYRHDRLGDLTRIKRQQTFMRAVLREMLQARNLPRLPRLLKLFAETVETDLTIRDLEAMADLMKGIEPNQVEAATLPGVPVDIKGISYLDPDYQQLEQVVNEVLFDVPPRVAIVNATEIPGVEAGLVKRLADAGFKVTEVRFATHSAGTSQVMDRAEHTTEVAEIRRWLGCGDVVKANGDAMPGAEITVLLGTDYIGKTAN